MITRVSLIPFYLGGSDQEANQQALEGQGFEESPLSGYEKRLVGLDVSRWKLKEKCRNELKEELQDETEKALKAWRKDEFQKEAVKKFSEWQEEGLPKEMEEKFKSEEGERWSDSRYFQEHHPQRWEVMRKEIVARRKENLWIGMCNKFLNWKENKFQQEVEKGLCNRLEALTLYLERRGFGILVDRKESFTEGFQLSNHEAVVKLLKERQKLHVEVTKGSHVLAKLVSCLRRGVPSDTRGHSLGWKEVPYIFTFHFYVYQGITKNTSGASVLSATKQTRRGALALLEPSLVGLGDSEESSDSLEGFAQRISNLPVPQEFPDAEFPNIDTDSNVLCLATWAGLMVLGHSDGSGRLLDLYELLEVRIQIPWIAAYLVRNWCEKAHRQDEQLDSDELVLVRGHVVPLLKEGLPSHRRDLSSRLTKISEGLERTSKLEQEVSLAVDGLQWSLEAAEWEEDKRRRGYDVIVQGLLVTLALLQLVSLRYLEPLESLDKKVVVPIQALVAIGILLLFFRAWLARRLARLRARRRP